jgi:hypothetical protein
VKMADRVKMVVAQIRRFSLYFLEDSADQKV